MKGANHAFAMAAPSSAVKSQEFKVRPTLGKTREDQQDASRVFFSNDALQSLNLTIGKPCYLWKGEDATQRRVGIAWNAAASQNLGKTALQMFPSFKDTCGFKLEDKLLVSSAGDLRMAKTILLREVESSASADSHKEMWETLIRYKLGK